MRVGFVSTPTFYITFTFLTRCDSRTQLPFHLVIQAGELKMKYTPQSDFHVRINNFPHILFEVNSDPGQHDRIRLLLQASCMCRIGNWLRASTSRKLITIMAVYVDQHFKAHQYLLYQPNIQATKVAPNRFTGSLWLMQYFSRLSTTTKV